MIGPDTLNAIRAGVAAGRTYTEIAADIGVTRSVIAGIVYRHAKDVTRPEGTATRRKRSDRPPRKTKVDRPPTPPRPPRIRMPVAVPAEDTPIECVIVPFTVASGCRWPLWSADDPLESKAVCGARCSDGNPYCAGHDRLAHCHDRRKAA